MLDERQCSFICLSYLGVIRDRRINVFFNPLCRLKWRSPCNQNSLNALWMLSSDFCAWVQTNQGYVLGFWGAPSCWRNMTITTSICYGVCSVQFSRSVMSNFLQSHWLQHARLFCPSPTPGACSNSSRWVSDAIQPSHPLSSSSPPAFNLSQ